MLFKKESNKGEVNFTNFKNNMIIKIVPVILIPVFAVAVKIFLIFVFIFLILNC